ncbi:unnamed protein product [Phytomonas sp. EM1]|nr:unnamed protein product [Phytomonas sp. EM1]|eukprot:CCW59655.1 unnamed protein product [Phytomonas sp. isolate EM1]
MTKNSDPSSDEEKPLSPEARVALEERLAALRAQEAQRRASGPQIVEHATLGVSSEGAEHPSCDTNGNCIVEYEDYNDMYDDAFMHFIEETFLNNETSSWTDEPFEEHLQQLQGASDTCTQSHNSIGRRCFLSQTRDFRDFEVLWFVKFGDITSFQDQCTNQDITIKTFCDNQSRNALHYVADNGSIPMLELLTTLGVPYLQSEKGMTPMDVAVLTDQSIEFIAALSKLARNGNESQGSNSMNDEGRKTFEEVRSKFAPEPPKFVISRRPPTPTVFTQNESARSFWKCQITARNGKNVVYLNLGAIAKVPDTEAGIHLVVSDSRQGDLAAGVGSVGRLYSGWGLSRFLRPLDLVVKDGKGTGIKGSVSNTLIVLNAVPSGKVLSKNFAPDLPVGVIVSMVLHGYLESADAVTDMSDSRGKSLFAVAGYLAVDRAYQRKQVASMLMRGLGNELLVQHGCTALAFTTQTPIPQLPPSTSMVKWYRRALNANAVFKGPYAEDIFPEFYEEDEVLRADCVLKGTLAPTLRDTYAEALQNWCFVDVMDKSQTHAVFEFLRNRGKEGLELVYKWGLEEDLCQTLLSPDAKDNLKSLVRLSGNKNAPEDFIVFRLRQMRHHRTRTSDSTTEPKVKEGVSGGQRSIVVVQVVYAHFAGLKGVEKMSHILLIAQYLFEADVLLAPNLFGFTENDLVKSNFDEVTMWREMLYVLIKDEEKKGEGSDPTATFLPPIPASKISVPVFLL